MHERGSRLRLRELAYRLGQDRFGLSWVGSSLSWTRSGLGWSVSTWAGCTPRSRALVGRVCLSRAVGLAGGRSTVVGQTGSRSSMKGKEGEKRENERDERERRSVITIFPARLR